MARMLRLLLLFVLSVAALVWLGAFVIHTLRGEAETPVEQSLREAAQRAAAPPAPSAAAVELELARPADWHWIAWGGVVLLLGLALFDDPMWLRTRWLSVPAGLLLLVFGAAVAAQGRPRPSGRLAVSPAGLQFAVDDRQGEIAWGRVARVVLLTTGNLKAGGATTTALVVLDADGQAFLSEPLPIGPAAEWERLLASLPAWSGRPLERRRGTL